MFLIEFFVLFADYVDVGVIVKPSKWKLSNTIVNHTEGVNSAKNLYGCK